MPHHPVVSNPLYDSLRQIIQDARKGSYQAVNHAMVEAYWNIGRLIVEEKQAGINRAGYGIHLLKNLAERLTEEFGRGFSYPNLKNFRQFFLTFPKGYHDVNISADEKSYTVCSELSWSHYRLLMRVENPAARGYYIAESISQNWSVRALERRLIPSITSDCLQAATGMRLLPKQKR